ncbi:MAG: hypothetical protein WD076_10605, partial [Parvularculaceae bacterium]
MSASAKVPQLRLLKVDVRRFLKTRADFFLKDASGRNDPIQIVLATGLAAASIGYLAVLWIGLNDPLLDWFAFRQTQTAISVYSMLHGGPWFFYETPVLGAPWRIPFEAPVYQISVAIVAILTPLSLDAAGRVTSVAYLIGAIIVGVKVLRLLAPDDRRIGLVFALLMLASPQYLFWGRTFLIETCALFFCLLFLYAAIRFYRKPSASVFALMLLASLLGALAKATTWPAFALAFAMFWLFEIVRDRRVKILPSAGVIGVGVSSLLAVALWNGAADALKVQTAFGSYLTSKNLALWNFGTLAHRMDPALWTVHLPKRMLPDALGAYWPVMLIAATHLPRFGANAAVAIAGGILFMASIMVFTSLHIVHAYYQTANAIFLLAGAAALVAGMMNAGRARVALFCLFVLVAGQVYYFAKERLPFIVKDMRAEPTYVTALVARERVPEGSAIFAFGVDWSSEVHYYAERKGVAFAHWFLPQNALPALNDPGSVLGALALGGIVDCRKGDGGYAPEFTASIDRLIAKLIQEGAQTYESAQSCKLYAARE